MCLVYYEHEIIVPADSNISFAHSLYPYLTFIHKSFWDGARQTPVANLVP